MGLNLLDLSFAFTAGIFSPCSYPLLPGYISYYLGSKAPISKAISGSLMCALELIAVFSIVRMLASTIRHYTVHIRPPAEPSSWDHHDTYGDKHVITIGIVWSVTSL